MGAFYQRRQVKLRTDSLCRKTLCVQAEMARGDEQNKQRREVTKPVILALAYSKEEDY
jgi:hypothetical protein